jgi:ADP-heptose:LPS heptosyltransferase
MKKTLVVHISDIGDIICGSIVLDTLKEQGHQVDYLVPAPLHPLYADDARVHSLFAPNNLPTEKYDLVIDLTSDKNSRALMRKLKGKKLGRVKSLSQRLRHWVTYHQMVDKVLNHHIVEDYYPVLRALGDEKSRLPLLPKSAENSTKEVAIHFGAHNAKRVLPMHLLKASIADLHARGFVVHLLGTEQDLGLEIMRETNGVARFEKRNLAQVKALIANVKLFIGADSGLLHMAAALGTPAIGVFGPNVTRRSGPKQQQVSFFEKDLPCRPCNQNVECPINVECMRTLDAWKFIEHIHQRLA